MSRDFKFADHAAEFDEHIQHSIPGLDTLRRLTVDLSRTFVRPGTSVLDLGCSTGSMLSSIREANAAQRANVQYVGIDAEDEFREHWGGRAAPNLRFEVRDVRTCGLFSNLSLVTSLFTMQFLPECDRLSLLRRVHQGLNEEGGFVIAEKVMADTARFQDIFLGPYYDFKLRNFSEKEILDKERALRSVMRLWSESELIDRLVAAGFNRYEIHRFWQNYLFVGVIAIKRPPLLAASRLNQAG